MPATLSPVGASAIGASTASPPERAKRPGRGFETAPKAARRNPAEPAAILSYLDQLVLCNASITGNQFRVLSCMALRAKGGLIYADGVRELAALAGQDARTVSRHLNELTRAGFLERLEAGRWRGWKSSYRLLLPWTS